MKKFYRILSLALMFCMLASFASAAGITETEEHIHSDGISQIDAEAAAPSGIQQIGDTGDGAALAEEPSGIISMDSEGTDDTVTPDEPLVSSEPAAAPTEPVSPTVEPGSLHANLIADPTGGRMTWELDNGALWIGGSGLVKPITSADEQPWADVRDQIEEVYFHADARLVIESIAYWFSGCVNLTYAEIPSYAFNFGADTFKDCTKLEELALYHSQDPEFSETTFSGTDAADIIVYVNGPEALTAVENAFWYGRSVEAIDLSEYPSTTYSTCGINGCYCSSCSWYHEYDDYDEYTHIKYEQCDSCSANEYAYGIRSAHTYNSRGICTVCGHEEEVETCDHSRTYNEWSGCTYYIYCYYCDEYLGSGVEHGTYTYGAWSYYTTSQHRRTATCNDCGTATYDYGSHSTTKKYTNYSDTQHKVENYCSGCSSTVGSASYASHSYSYGSWSSYSASQHRRTKSCTYCDLSTYEYGNHADGNSDGKCDTCSYTMTLTVTWNASANGGAVNGSASVTTTVANGSVAAAPSYTPVKMGHTFKGWYSASTGGSLYSSVAITSATTFYAQFTAASYTVTFDPGEGTTTTTSKSVTYGGTFGELPVPTRGGYNFDGWFTAADGGTQITADTKVDITADTTIYAHWTRLVSFSVTVPAVLPLVMDEDGEVYGATAAIVNNSTGEVQISSVSLSAENGWSIAPFSMNTAHEKVDAKRIGFSLQDIATKIGGDNETLEIPETWTIDEGNTLELAYDAIVTALSQPVSETNVLSAIFVIKWIDR